MSAADRWSVELSIGEHEGETRADARLVMDNDAHLLGHGTARRNPSGSLLIRDVEVQAAACRDRVDQGLQLRWRGRFGPCLPPALQRDPGGKPGAYRA